MTGELLCSRDASGSYVAAQFATGTAMMCRTRSLG
jgi:hypothetical protein